MYFHHHILKAVVIIVILANRNNKHKLNQILGDQSDINFNTQAYVTTTTQHSKLPQHHSYDLPNYLTWQQVWLHYLSSQ